MEFNLKKTKIEHFLSTVLGVRDEEAGQFEYQEEVLSFTHQGICWSLTKAQKDFLLRLSFQSNDNVIAHFGFGYNNVSNGMPLSVIDRVWEGLEIFWEKFKQKFPSSVKKIQLLLKES